MRRVAGAPGRPVAKGPGLRREADSTWVERLVEKLDDVEDRGVKREEAEVRDRWWRDFEAELQRTGLAEQAAHLQVVGRVGHRAERRPVTENAAAHLGQARHRGPGVGGDHGREAAI